MRAAGPNIALEPLPWSKASAVMQFSPTPALDVVRAVENSGPPKVSFGPFRLFPTLFLLLQGDEPVALGSRALEILIVLLERRGELVSKQELISRVWPDVFVDPSNLTVHMSALRRALRDGRDGNRFIINIKGRGYRFVASVGVSGHDNRARARD
jgi:DNA-binding winged helix-turn-helix (wHTH) protein